MSDLKDIFEKVISDKVRTIPEKARVIERARKDGRLLAVRGSMDYVERVLPYCYVGQKELLDAHRPPPRLDEFDAIFVGCPGKLGRVRLRQRHGCPRHLPLSPSRLRGARRVHFGLHPDERN